MTDLRWGVLSSARIAQNRFIPAVQATAGMTVRAISSSRPEVGALAEQLHIPIAHTSHERLLADDTIDAVYIPLPNALHAEWIVAAAEAGKHVFCEKPLVSSAAELEAVVEVAERQRVLVMEAFMYRHHPQYTLLRGLFAQGELGDVVELHGRFHFTIDRRGDDIRFRPDLAGGSLNDIGCYPIDAIVMLLGREPNLVQAAAVNQGLPVDSSVTAILNYGTTVASMGCGFDGPLLNTLDVVGTRAAVHLDRAFDPLPGETAHVVITSRSGDQRVHSIVTDQFANGAAAFAKALADQGHGLFDLDLTRASTSTRLAVRLSMLSGTRVLAEAGHDAASRALRATAAAV